MFLIPLSQKVWSNARSDESRLRVLVVVERLLNQSLFQGAAASVSQFIFRWLCHLEDVINPYRRYILLLARVLYFN